MFERHNREIALNNPPRKRVSKVFNYLSKKRTTRRQELKFRKKSIKLFKELID